MIRNAIINTLALGFIARDTVAQAIKDAPARAKTLREQAHDLVLEAKSRAERRGSVAEEALAETTASLDA